jgi:hypothetical protein
MTMLEVVDKLVELLRGLAAESAEPVAIEKYRRLEAPARPCVYVTPVAQREVPEAIGGQYAERLEVEVRCEVAWDGAPVGDADLLLRVADAAMVVVEKNREIGEAKRGKVGEVRYGIRQRAGMGAAFFAAFRAEYTAEKSKTGSLVGEVPEV